MGLPLPDVSYLPNTLSGLWLEKNMFARILSDLAPVASYITLCLEKALATFRPTVLPLKLISVQRESLHKPS